MTAPGELTQPHRSAPSGLRSADLDETSTPTSQLAFYDYPAEHWIHLRTTNPIESTFATVRHRTKVTKGPGSKAAGIAMAVKLIEAAQERWRAVNAPRLVALVRAGARLERGKLVERDPVLGATQAADDTPVPPPAASNHPVSNAA